MTDYRNSASTKASATPAARVTPNGAAQSHTPRKRWCRASEQAGDISSQMAKLRGGFPFWMAQAQQALTVCLVTLEGWVNPDDRHPIRTPITPDREVRHVAR